jgi:tRNA threonylcarbamoyladenosine biosynthesis protein TsaE
MGHKLRGGEVIELVSDLGGGKTTFVRGLANGLGSRDRVHSPSFTLANQYQADQLTLHHFDFYRLQEPGIMQRELAEILTEPAAIIVVEWPAIIDNILPAKRVTVQIATKSETTRQLIFSYPSELAYLIPQDT